MKPAPVTCGPTIGVGVKVTRLAFAVLARPPFLASPSLRGAVDAAAGVGSSFVKNRTALVTPKVTATPKAMSAMSECVSPLSAVEVVGFLSKLLLSLSARTPKTVPTPAAATASPPVMYAGMRLRGSGRGGAGGGGGAGGAATTATGGGGGSGSSAAVTVCVDANATSTDLLAGSRPAWVSLMSCVPEGSSTSSGVTSV